MSPTDCEHVLKQIELYLDGELVASHARRDRAAPGRLRPLQRARRVPGTAEGAPAVQVRVRPGTARARRPPPDAARPAPRRTPPSPTAPVGRAAADLGTEPPSCGRRIGNMTKGSRPGNLPAPSRALEPGRVCAHEGCRTTLSVYNEGDVLLAARRRRLPELPRQTSAERPRLGRGRIEVSRAPSLAWDRRTVRFPDRSPASVSCFWATTLGCIAGSATAARPARAADEEG